MRPRRTRLAVALLAAGLAGGAAVVGGNALPAYSAPTFGGPVVVSGEDTGEPAIDVAGDGDLYINAPAGLLADLPGSPSFVWRSRSSDGGAQGTWKLVNEGLRQAAPGGGDSEIAVDPVEPDTLYMTDLWLGSATVSSSTDDGGTWVANPVQGVPVQDRQWIATTGNGVVYHATHQIPAGLVVSKSIDGGHTFPVNSVAATPLDQTGCVCPPGTLVAAPGGGLLGQDRVGLLYSTSTGGVKFARSVNGGLTFSNAVVAPGRDGFDTAAAFPVVAWGGGSRLVAVWQEVAGNRSRVAFARSDDWGATWTGRKTIVSAGTSVFPWVDARGNKVAVTLYHTSATGTPDNVGGSAKWYEKYLQSTDGGNRFPTTLVTVDSNSVKTGPICTQGIACEEDRELLDFQAVAIDRQGRANVTWTRSVDGESDTEIRFSRQQ